MKLLILITPFLLFSCASHKNPRAIKEAKNDGLKFESLQRFDHTRLVKIGKGASPITLCFQGKIEKALNIYKNNLDKNVNKFKYWNQVSTCYIIKKDYSKAKFYLDLALGRAKNNNDKAIVLNNFGVVYMETKNYKKAKDYFQSAIKLHKNYLTPRYNLAQIHLRFGHYKKSQLIINKLLTYNKYDIDFLQSKAHIELMLNNYKKSLQYFNKIPKQYLTRDDIATNMAMSYFMLGEYNNALNAIKNADKTNTYYTNSLLEIQKRIESQASKS